MPAHRHASNRHRGTRRVPALLVLAALAWGTGTVAAAQTVYKCTDAKGHLSFQDAPCGKDQHQRVLHLHVPTPTPDASRPPAPASSPPPRTHWYSCGMW